MLLWVIHIWLMLKRVQYNYKSTKLVPVANFGDACTIISSINKNKRGLDGSIECALLWGLHADKESLKSKEISLMNRLSSTKFYKPFPSLFILYQRLYSCGWTYNHFYEQLTCLVQGINFLNIKYLIQCTFLKRFSNRFQDLSEQLFDYQNHF